MRVPDPAFADPRLAVLYDAFEDGRDDLDVYVALAAELAATSVVDVGCGTGELAVRLARAGFEVVGVDPAVASIDVARAKPGADRVTWVEGDLARATHVLDGRRVDLVAMTGNVSQVFVDDSEWQATLDAARRLLRPDGHLVFETRRPDARAWEEWTVERTLDRRRLADGTMVATWVELLDDGSDEFGADPVTVSFRWTYVFDPDGPRPETLTSDSTLRFRQLHELRADLETAGFEVVEVRDAPDRPAREWVFVARAMCRITP